MTPEEVWREAAAAACCAIKWKPSANRKGAAVIRTAMEAYAAEKVAEERAAIVEWLRKNVDTYPSGSFPRCGELASYWRAAADGVADNQHHGGNDADT